MKYRITIMIILISAIILSIYIKNLSNDKVIDSDIWNKVSGKVWSNYDIWAGEGVYFYENEGKPICAYMIYGSGVYIAGLYESVVEIKDNEIIIEVIGINDKTNTVDRLHLTRQFF